MKKIQTLLKFQLPVVFILLLILPFLNSEVGIWTFERIDENRRFQDSLSLDINRLDSFPKEADAYLNDNFSFRTPLLDLYHRIKFSYFKISPYPDRSIVGKDGWFFIAGREKEIYEGNLNYSQAALNSFLVEWKYRKTYLDSLNIKTYWIIAPFKHYVYSEYMPFNIYHSKIRRVDQIKEYFKKELPDLILDLLPLLKENKDSCKLYYKLDNHWNSHSAYLVTKGLLEKIRTDFPNDTVPDIPPFVWEEKEVNSGFHYNVIGIKELSEIKQTPVMKNLNSIKVEKYGFKFNGEFGYADEYEIRYLNKKLKSGLKILIIRDSFAGVLIPFIREEFKESVFIWDKWQYGLNKQIIEVVKPDVVVFLGLETHIDNLLKDYK